MKNGGIVWEDGVWGCQVKGAVIKRGRSFSLEIDNMTINVKPQEEVKIPLMGVSGAGKSTLLNLLSGMEWPEGGEVTWRFPDRKEISWGKHGLSSAAAMRLRREYFGFAFQNSSLLPHLRVIDNLSYPLQLKKIGLSKARKTILDILPNVLLDNEDLHEILERYPSQLSGGQKQRVAMVQAMLHNPYVLFADEPTGSLDMSTREQVMKVLIDWVREGNGKRLLLWVTHHEDDPQVNNVNIRLHIDVESEKSSKYKWQQLNSHGWEDINGMDATCV